MAHKIEKYFRHAISRAVIFIFLVTVAFATHRFFASNDKDIIGALLFIAFFSVGTLSYYFSLLRDKTMHKIEFALSLIFIIMLTITMFGLIYFEPITENDNYFIQQGKAMNLSLPDAMYFSATTITNAAFGDIVPVGIYRLFTVIEIFFGLIYTGTFIYFIIKAIEG